MVIAFYISGHGFGHAARSFAVIRAIWTRRPEVRVMMRSAIPSWFLESSLNGPVELQTCEVDTGMAQIDSLVLDEHETARRAAAFYATFSARIGEEVDVLHRAGARVVVGDVPPLAFAAAEGAGVPSIAVANFTWDWIYAAYPLFEEEAPGVVATISDAYARATRALRLPFHGGFEPMDRVTRDIPLVGRHARRPRTETRQLLGLGDETVVLASFGGHGFPLPYAQIAERSSLTILTTDVELDPRDQPTRSNRLKHIDRRTSTELRLRYEDLVAASDVVVSKPGYGIVSECIANGVPLLYTSRGFFPEYDILVRDMPRTLRCAFIPQEDLASGLWSDAVTSLLAQPPAPEQMPTHGADVAAEQILDLCEREASAE